MDGQPIIDRCLALGFAQAGIVPCAPSSYAIELRDWLAAGRQGSMDYLARNVEVRLDPARLLHGARSIILVADLYHTRAASARATSRDRPHGRIARYARGRDYHLAIKKRLHALCDALRAEHAGAEFRAFADTAPILEREHAARAGLGWIGKHTLLIHPRLGSYTLLGGVLTTLPLDPPTSQLSITDHCGTCTRCIDACPTRAITPYSVDASRCIAYLTIERRLPIPEPFHAAIGDNLFGCDICQDVCPHNSPRPDTFDAGRPHPAYAPVREDFDLLEVLGWTEDDRRHAFQGSALKRATLDMMKRNAIIVLANLIDQGRADRPALDRLRQASEDAAESELVRQTARAALRRLAPERG